ncbi:MAG TPA: hypothetical protein VLM37_02260 [Fibrobacteraceae bacterium]|nr:hypothetical protein [Fibrobacteraceae bacterium]
MSIRRPPDYTVDSLIVTQPNEGQGWYHTSAPYVDENGWLWVHQNIGRIMVIHGDSVKYIFSLSKQSGVGVRAQVNPDSVFWICTETALWRYSEKYSVPDEATSVTTNVSLPVEALVLPLSGGVRILTGSSGQWGARIYSAQGRLAWSGSVSGQVVVPLQPGIWVVRVTGPNAQSLQRTIGVLR